MGLSFLVGNRYTGKDDTFYREKGAERSEAQHTEEETT